MKKETLEENTEVTFANEIEQISDYDKGRWYGRIEGANWQQERMYSEEDMIEFGFSTYCYISELMDVPFNLISENKLHAMYNFEQFKNK